MQAAFYESVRLVIQYKMVEFIDGLVEFGRNQITRAIGVLAGIFDIVDNRKGEVRVKSRFYRVLFLPPMRRIRRFQDPRP